MSERWQVNKRNCLLAHCDGTIVVSMLISCRCVGFRSHGVMRSMWQLLFGAHVLYRNLLSRLHCRPTVIQTIERFSSKRNVSYFRMHIEVCLGCMFSFCNPHVSLSLLTCMCFYLYLSGAFGFPFSYLVC